MEEIEDEEEGKEEEGVEEGEGGGLELFKQ